MTIMPHDHRMWAVIGVYTGREDNIFWRRIKGDAHGRIEAVGARALGVRDAEPLGHNIIHSVTNPISRLTGAIHVYGGDFFAAERSEWDPESLREESFDAQRAVQRFDEANASSRVR
jgi:predicted metal-dependent enzyme (double-stranded beta helix superfamily)